MSESVILGDRHNGQTTKLVRRDGKDLIQKPRDALTEKVWASLLRSLSEMGMKNLPRAVTVLSDDGNSHIEEPVKHTPTDLEGVKRYARRFGTLLFLTYLLSSADLHAENIIADGEYPILVDVEALLSAEIARSHNKKAIFSTVYASSLLPNFVDEIDTSGGTGTISDYKNFPIVDGRNVSVADYRSEVLDGFSDSYSFVLAHKTEIEPLIHKFSRCRFREIIRDTRVYGYVLDKIWNAENPREKAEEMLSRAFKKDPDPNRIKQASLQLKAEVDAVIRGDVPLFYVYGDRRDLCCDGVTVMKNFYTESPVERACHRLLMLSEQDKTKQLQLIALIFACKDSLIKEETDASSNFEDQAVSEIERCHIENFPSQFIYLTSVGGHRILYRDAGYGLYDGLAGIMCAYAAIAVKTQNLFAQKRVDEFLDEIENVCINISNRELTIFEKSEYTLNSMSCGLSRGYAGTVAGLLHTYELTGNKRAYILATELVKCFEPNVINADNLDLLTGLSGICLSLPKLPETMSLPFAEVLFPILCDSDCTLTGAAHGAAGRALALAALGKVFGDGRCDNTILSLLAWENSQYDSNKNNWRDLRNTQKSSFMHGWCAGAPGIGMTRLRLSQYTNNPEIREICLNDVERVKMYLKAYNGGNIRSTLCCGEASRVMAAAALGIKIDNKLKYSFSADSPRLLHYEGTADLNPTLMQGVSGVAYAYFMQNDERCGGMLL